MINKPVVTHLWPTPVFEKIIPVKDDWKSYAINSKYNRMNSDNGYISSNQSVLDDFFPRYVSVIKKFDRDIRRLRIEGHTSSEWGRFESEDDRYLNNLDLSQRRAFNVLKYCLNTLWFPEKKWIKKKLGSEGLSSSQLIKNDFGYEDKKRSRRTVFKIDIKHGDYYLNNPQNNLYTKLGAVQ